QGSIKDREYAIGLVELIKGADDHFSYEELYSLYNMPKREMDDFIRQKLKELDIFSDHLSIKYTQYIISVLNIQKHIMYEIGNKKIKNMIYFKAKEKANELEKDYCNEWIRHSIDKMNVIEIDGKHISVVKQPYVKNLAKELNKILVVLRLKYESPKIIMTSRRVNIRFNKFNMVSRVSN